MRLIDADALKKAIEECADKIQPKMQGRRNGKTLAHSYLTSLALVQKMIEEQPTVDDENWILCTDRLPEESDYYMACVYDEEVDDYDYRKTWFAHKDDYDMDESEWRELQPFEKVVGWKRLPEPPEWRNAEDDDK